jgi:hypothetical protein
VDADKRTLTPEDFAKVMDLLKLRPMQFCIYLKALVGADEMQRMMVEAVKVARQVSSGTWAGGSLSGERALKRFANCQPRMLCGDAL